MINCLNSFQEPTKIIAIAAVLHLSVLSGVAVSQVSITSDNTTSTQVVTTDKLNFAIDGGILLQGNLFHSFQSFSVPTGGSAQFSNPQATNIFARVTGVSASNINGLVQTNGNANLILINPKGIQFGPNAFLKVGGSFLASSADAIVFNDNQQFSAVAPQSAPILTVSTPLGLQFGNSPGDILVQSGFGGVSVPSGQTLALIGGDITLDAGSLTAASGRIEIGSVAKQGFVPLITTSQPAGWQFDFGNIDNFGNIQLLGEIVETPFFSFISGSFVSTSDLSGDEVSGDISISGRNIDIVEGSLLQTSHSASQLGGNIVLNASDTVKIVNLPVAGVRAIPGGLITSTTADGPAGNIQINAKNLEISGEAITLAASSSARAIIQGGALELIAATGPAGNIQLNIADTITLSDGASIGASSTFGIGTSGKIELNTRALNLVRGGRIETFTTGPNPAGEIIVNASEQVVIDGSLLNLGTSSGLLSLSAQGATGPGGSITIDTDLLRVTNGGVVSVQTNSIANAGNLFINASQASILDGGQLISTSSNQGSAGQIQLSVQDKLIILGRNSTFSERLQQVDELRLNPFPTLVIIPIGVSAESGIITSALEGATGPGGSIDITTGQLRIARQGMISSSTAGPGNANKIDIRASQGVSLTDPGSGVFANTTATGQGGTISFFTPNFLIEKRAVVNASTSGNGRGGSIFTQANRFTARQGGQLLSTASGQGPAGDITLQVRDNITLTGANSGLFASTTPDSTGAAGNIFIDPIQVLIANGAVVSATSLGMGEGGDIQLRARNLTLDQGQITAEAAVAPAGDIQLNIDNFLLLRNGSLISTTAGGDATGGNIDINAQLVTAFPLENSDITANALNGPGGNITITTQGVFGLEVRDTLTNSSDITAFSQTNPQLNGIVEIITPEVDPSENLSEQPEAVEKPTEIARGCKAPTSSSSFVSKGRGGLPQHPAAALSGEAIWQDLRVQDIQTTEQPVSQTTSQTTSQVSISAPSQWVEAKAWRRLPDGKVKLVAQGGNYENLPPTASC